MIECEGNAAVAEYMVGAQQLDIVYGDMQASVVADISKSIGVPDISLSANQPQYNNDLQNNQPETIKSWNNVLTPQNGGYGI